MADGSMAGKLAATASAGRARAQPDGSVVYQLTDGSGAVRLAQADWERLSDELDAGLAAVRKRTLWAALGLLPTIFLYGMTFAQVLPFGGPIILAGLFLGPVAICAMHEYSVRRTTRSIEARLPAHERVAPIGRDGRHTPGTLEQALLALVAAHLLVAAIGEIGGPDMFRGTPLWGAGIGLVELLGAALLALRLGPRLLSRGR